MGGLCFFFSPQNNDFFYAVVATGENSSEPATGIHLSDSTFFILFGCSFVVEKMEGVMDTDCGLESKLLLLCWKMEGRITIMNNSFVCSLKLKQFLSIK